MFRNKIIKKGIVFGIFLWLLIGSVYTIVGKTNNAYENENYLLFDKIFNAKVLLLNENIAYIQGGFELDCWLYKIPLNNPTDPTCICSEYPGSGNSGTVINEGVIITSEQFTGQLYEINPLTCDWKIIGGGGVDLNGIAYDPIDAEIYACTYDGLYNVDRETGEQDFIGRFEGGVLNMISLACDADGKLYGWDLADNLFTINKNTGSATLVGPLGIDLSYASDGDFHKEDDILYITTYTSNLESYLYECDEDTGDCTLIGQFKYNNEVTLFAIPWNSPPAADFNWIPEHPDTGETVLFDGSLSSDPDDNIVLYVWDWDNDGIYDESNAIPTTTHIYEEVGLYNVTLKVQDSYYAEDTKTQTVRVGNRPPEKPDIDGPTTGRPGNWYKFCLTPVDPDDEEIFYARWDWDGGDITDWLGPFSSEEDICEYHLWNFGGKRTIKAQIKDEFGAESEWGELEIKIPRNIVQHNLLILRLLERFPLIKQIISFLGGYSSFN